MTAFLTSPHIVDAALLVLALEAAALPRLTRRPPLAILTALLPGAFLLLALRAALAGASWPWVAFWLAAALPAHLYDLWRRRP